MRRHALRLFKLWLIRQLTFAPLIVFLAVGFRTGAGAMTPEARWHPALKWAGPLAVVVLGCLASGRLPFDPMALGMLLFLIVGAAGVLGLHHGFTGIHAVYAPMAQAMLFAWIAAVFAALALIRPAALLGAPPMPEAPLKTPPRVRIAAWALAALAVAAAAASWLLRTHEMLAGLLPFLALAGARIGARHWAVRGMMK